MTQILTQNTKMRKTAAKTGVSLFNFGIPAFKSNTGLITCPSAKYCVAGCYAKTGTYRFKNSVNAYEARLKLTLSNEFHAVMDREIKKKAALAARKKQKLFIRIHDSGDFYSEAYAMTWFNIMKDNPNVSFYAYTKRVNMFKRLKLFNEMIIPDNFTLIFSLGGKEDNAITLTDRHARVFESLKALKNAGYVNGTDDDMVSAKGKNNKIGLVYHGVKNYDNTTWRKV